MELLFLLILLLLMVVSLGCGFPVAFALPGSAILAIGLAALCGYLFAGDASAYFAEGGPVQWLSAGITNFRSLYWDVERDTLIAVPLFIFMGIMLQRSKIAEDLLVAMSRLFGPIPGGLGISVIIVGALLAATTGIVGATVIAMGLISLPAMLRNNYSKPLATGTICASGTLGQIIPPSIVLIILADQLANAASQASNLRKEMYRNATGEFTMPSHLDITSASAGDMFMGAMIPGLILVGLYIIYMLVNALLKPESAPPVPYEGKYDRDFAKKVALALLPPLTLIFVVLGSIIAGVATVNQAGAIGAVGALIMGSYRLVGKRKGQFYPAIIAISSVVILGVLVSLFDLNVRDIQPGEGLPIVLAALAAMALLGAVGWSIYRVYKVENILTDVMRETAVTTCMVFIIMIGAAMLTSAFRAFGGEELVKHFLQGIPGGFWMQFAVVMLVIFLLGFFLDYIEIAVVVVPIVAPILLADPSANITAVWLGVMISMNLQTSFLTPPFGFALFYLRGVAPKIIKTLDIYKGAVIFICLQIVAMVIVGFSPKLTNYFPARSHLLSDTAPPPMNPNLQACLEPVLFDYYSENEGPLRQAIQTLASTPVAYLPIDTQHGISEIAAQSSKTFELVANVRSAEQQRIAFESDYYALHTQARFIQRQIAKLTNQQEELGQRLRRLDPNEAGSEATKARLNQQLQQIPAQIEQLQHLIPAQWEAEYKAYQGLQNDEKKARFAYRNNVDGLYDSLNRLITELSATEQLAAFAPRLDTLTQSLTALDKADAYDFTYALEKEIGDLDAGYPTKSALSKARRKLKKGGLDDAQPLLDEAIALYHQELNWRQQAQRELLPQLQAFEAQIRFNMGLRQQPHMLPEQAKAVASCQSVHKDISLNF